jgi:hypothetical protein
MDSRIFVLPLASIAIVLFLLMRPDITGFIVAGGPLQESEISAKIAVTISEDGFVPEDAIVTVYLDENKASMKFSDFVFKTGSAFNRIREYMPKINYDGYGYGGPYAYTLDISAFGLGTTVGPGEHELIIEVSYEDFVSRSSQKITT